jgi:predicted deacylase
MSENSSIIIGRQEIAPGENKTIKLNVGRLPSDTGLYIQANIFRSENPGPTLLILGGIHGDEINGIEIVRRSLQNGLFDDLKIGNVIAIPVLNIFGFINFSREVPDGKDVNRSFPGNTGGSLASRVARTLTKLILPHVDYALDFHTGGASRYNYPQIRYSAADKKAEELANAFAAPYLIQKVLIPKTFRRAAKLMGIPAIVFEGGESIRLDGPAIQMGIEGIKRVMNHLNYSDFYVPKLTYNPLTINKTSWIRAPYSGMFEWTKSSGQEIKKGEPIGYINDVFGTKTVVVTASKNGYIIGHNNASVVNQGDALFHIGYEFKN